MLLTLTPTFNHLQIQTPKSLDFEGYISQRTLTKALPAGVTLLHDHRHRAAQRLDASPGCAVLLRPDQHLAARWRGPTLAAVQAALARACAQA